MTIQTFLCFPLPRFLRTSKTQYPGRTGSQPYQRRFSPSPEGQEKECRQLHVRAVNTSTWHLDEKQIVVETRQLDGDEDDVFVGTEKSEFAFEVVMEKEEEEEEEDEEEYESESEQAIPPHALFRRGYVSQISKTPEEQEQQIFLKEKQETEAAKWERRRQEKEAQKKERARKKKYSTTGSSASEGSR